jgi:phosphomannomutase
MAKDIVFGTDGWRDRMYNQFTQPNVHRVLRAIATYTKQEGGEKKGIVIGYDARFFSDHFAGEAAKVLTEEGIKVYIMPRDLPTPVIAFAVQQKGAFGAVMFTASHNPPEYNGIKFIPYYAGPATEDITSAIESAVPEVSSAVPVLREEFVDHYDPLPDYLARLRQLVDVERIRKSGIRLGYDPMFGSGRGVLDALLSGLDLHVIRNWRDPLFDGAMPDPQENLLKSLIEWVAATPGALGLATDGDADRFGIVDDGGVYITPNQLIPLLCYHLVKNRGFKGVVGRSIATTHLLDRLADHFGLGKVETKVGFKYLGELMRNEKTVICGEESGGLSIGGHIPEKDGILACALAAELRVTEGRPLRAILNDIWAMVGPSYSQRVDYHINPEDRPIILERLRSAPPETVAGKKVVNICTKEGFKFILDNNDWFLVRPSGTEPLFRLYLETAKVEDLEPMKHSVQAWFENNRK